ncbi:hypothetical protein BDP27DRAFT_1441959 [Rhodocollybia butyracea]|uniref:Uncharacterized protein n=1 Tax=Rhodocollybia butyracea TaxID=206335 RepID=A0A9P5UGA0_9AGAR|nr:hypothetical protein BDP27DRAFT_1441959 [Rhodocollybia butyracea]
MAPTVHEEYAELMSPNGTGRYLFRPQPFSECHPGAIGCFDKHGTFIQVTDLSEPGRLEEDGYMPFGHTLTRAPPETSVWKTRSSGSEGEHSFGVEGGVSGALSAAPVDFAAKGKNKWGKTGKAALITNNHVVEDKFWRSPRGPIQDWIKANGKALVRSKYRCEIADHGLWAISKTWSTDECQIKMESAHSRDASGGLKVGSTGIAKGGVSASSLVKSNSEGWTTYKASETDGSLVVAYGGTGFKLAIFTKFLRRGPWGGMTVHSAANAEEEVEEEVGFEIDATFGESDSEEEREENEEFEREIMETGQIQDETERNAPVEVTSMTAPSPFLGISQFAIAHFDEEPVLKIGATFGESEEEREENEAFEEKIHGDWSNPGRDRGGGCKHGRGVKKSQVKILARLSLYVVIFFGNFGTPSMFKQCMHVTAGPRLGMDLMTHEYTGYEVSWAIFTARRLRRLEGPRGLRTR